MPIRFFKSSSEFRNWLQQNHDNAELFVGFHRKNSGRPSVTWPEAVDQALCFGWIDGVRKSIDAHSYCIRFTPRQPKSIWSRINVNRVQELSELGLMQAAGLKVFNERDQTKTKLYEYENAPAKLTHEDEQKFRDNEKAWRFFQTQAPSYRRVCIWWVVRAKHEDTRRRRLAILIEDSAKGQLSATFRWRQQRKR